jgi:hypothetical protein
LSPIRASWRLGWSFRAAIRSASVFFGFLASRLDFFCPLATAVPFRVAPGEYYAAFPTHKYQSRRHKYSIAPSSGLYFYAGPVILLQRTIWRLTHLPTGGDQSSFEVKDASNEHPCLAEARTVGGGVWRGHPGICWFFAARVANRFRRQTGSPGHGRHRGRRGARAILYSQSAAGRRRGNACEATDGTVFLLEEQHGSPGGLGHTRAAINT